MLTLEWRATPGHARFPGAFVSPGAVFNSRSSRGPNHLCAERRRRFKPRWPGLSKRWPSWNRRPGVVRNLALPARGPHLSVEQLEEPGRSIPGSGQGAVHCEEEATGEACAWQRRRSSRRVLTAESSAAKVPQRTTLPGRFVTLVPLDPAAHAAALYQASHGPEREDLWRYLFDGPYPDRPAFDARLQQMAASRDPLFFTILDRTQVPVGYAAYLRIEPVHRCIEVGSILYTPALQRTPGATEAMYLMARHIFEDLEYRRYEWKCNALNEPSRRAALRLGFVFEGIFRQHMIIKGRNRDTAWYSMLDSEWPARKATFERWLAAENFDGNRRQKESLSRMNNAFGA